MDALVRNLGGGRGSLGTRDRLRRGGGREFEGVSSRLPTPIAAADAKPACERIRRDEQDDDALNDIRHLEGYIGILAHHVRANTQVAVKEGGGNRREWIVAREQGNDNAIQPIPIGRLRIDAPEAAEDQARARDTRDHTGKAHCQRDRAAYIDAAVLREP